MMDIIELEVLVEERIKLHRGKWKSKPSCSQVQDWVYGQLKCEYPDVTKEQIEDIFRTADLMGEL